MATTNPLGSQLAEGLRILSPTRQGRPEDLRPVVPRVGPLYIYIINISIFRLVPVRRSQKKRAMTQLGLLHSSFSSRYYHYYPYSIFNIKTESHSWVYFFFFATDVRKLKRYFFRTILSIFVRFLDTVIESKNRFSYPLEVFWAICLLNIWSKNMKQYHTNVFDALIS